MWKSDVVRCCKPVPCAAQASRHGHGGCLQVRTEVDVKMYRILFFVHKLYENMAKMKVFYDGSCCFRSICGEFADMFLCSLNKNDRGWTVPNDS